MKILYILSSYNIYGGTPKKTLDSLKYFNKRSSLYVYSNSYKEFKPQFEQTGAKIHEGTYGRNLYFHLRQLLKIIDKNQIDIVQTQFSMGETLGYLIKIFRPHVRLVVAFIGSSEPSRTKKIFLNYIYKKVDVFVYISQFVKGEKEGQFPLLVKKTSTIIYNGTEKRQITGDAFPIMRHPSLFSISGLAKCKNINILIEALNCLKKQGEKKVFLYIAGDGPERKNLEQKINQYKLNKQVFLLGYQKNIGDLLEQTDIYLHPCYIEGFGIAVAEAMMASKPMILADAGALPELIENEKSGFIVDPFDAGAWADAILKLVEDNELAKTLGENARKRAEELFSIEPYVSSYESLYQELLDDSV